MRAFITVAAVGWCMPVKGFDVVVSTDNSSQNKAIASASQYLAYADQTDTFGYHGDVTEVSTELHDGTFTVILSFVATIVSDDELKAFMDEMTTLSRVKSVERKAYVI